jgi:hypothetical protein
MSVKWKESRGKYEVRWHEGSGQRSRLFERKGDADAFDLEIKRRKQLGALAPSVLQSRMTLAEFVEEDWWPRYAIPNLADDTRRRYLELWGTHLLPRLGDYELRAFTSLLVEDFRDQLTRSRVPSQTVRQSLMLLQGILRRAVVRGLIPVNPVRDVPKPKQKPPAAAAAALAAGRRADPPVHAHHVMVEPRPRGRPLPRAAPVVAAAQCDDRLTHGVRRHAARGGQGRDVGGSSRAYPARGREQDGAPP